MGFSSRRRDYFAGDGVDSDDLFVTSQPLVSGYPAEMDLAAAGRVRAALRESIERHQTPRGIFYGSAAWLVTATA